MKTRSHTGGTCQTVAHTRDPPLLIRNVVLVRRESHPLSEKAKRVHGLIVARAADEGPAAVARPLNLLIPFSENGPVVGGPLL